MIHNDLIEYECGYEPTAPVPSYADIRDDLCFERFPNDPDFHKSIVTVSRFVRSHSGGLLVSKQLDQDASRPSLEFDSMYAHNEHPMQHLVYHVLDKAGNRADPLTVQVQIVDTLPPTLDIVEASIDAALPCITAGHFSSTAVGTGNEPDYFNHVCPSQSEEDPELALLMGPGQPNGRSCFSTYRTRECPPSGITENHSDVATSLYIQHSAGYYADIASLEALTKEFSGFHCADKCSQDNAVSTSVSWHKDSCDGEIIPSFSAENLGLVATYAIKYQCSDGWHDSTACRYIKLLLYRMHIKQFYDSSHRLSVDGMHPTVS